MAVDGADEIDAPGAYGYFFPYLPCRVEISPASGLGSKGGRRREYQGLAEYVGVLILLAMVSVPACLCLVLARRGRRRHRAAPGEFSSPGRASPAEPVGEGSAPSAESGEREPVGAAPGARLLLAAMAFLVLQAAALLLVPWALAFASLGSGGLVSGFFFLLPLAVGFAYLWRKGALG